MRPSRRRQNRRELASHVVSIFGAHSKRDERTGIAQHRMPHVGLELVKVLVGKRERDAVLPEFR